VDSTKTQRTQSEEMNHSGCAGRRGVPRISYVKINGKKRLKPKFPLPAGRETRALMQDLDILPFYV
jgi:hypothetical protein